MKRTCLILLAAACFGAAYGRAAVNDSGPGLPVITLPAAADGHMPLVLLITGDGGWKGFDPKLAAQFTRQRVPVVALNALHYFWDKKTPEQAAEAVEGLLIKYMRQWHKKDFILAGFSFGADVMPFIVNRLPGDLMRSCRGVALFSPGTSTDFEIHISQMLNDRRQWKYSVVKEMEAMKPVPLLCFFGDKEHAFPVKTVSRPGWQLIYLKGGHHYENNRDDVAKMVLEKLGIGTE